jgi:hypothetical protein
MRNLSQWQQKYIKGIGFQTPPPSHSQSRSKSASTFQLEDHAASGQLTILGKISINNWNPSQIGKRNGELGEKVTETDG